MRFLEAAVFDAFRRLRQGRTTLVIAHRLSTAGRRSHSRPSRGPHRGAGTHAELLSSNQLYRRMCARLSIGKPLDDDRDVADALEPAI